MTPNQSWRSNLLRTVYLDGPQPIELRLFQNRTSDLDSKKWLADNGLEHYYEDRDISIYRKIGLVYWAQVKFIRFIWIASPQFETEYDQSRLQLNT